MPKAQGLKQGPQHKKRQTGMTDKQTNFPGIIVRLMLKVQILVAILVMR